MLCLFEFNFFNVWESTNLILLTLLHLSVRPLSVQNIFLFSFAFLLGFRTHVLVKCAIEFFIFVFPITNSPRNSNDALNSTFLYKAACSFYTLCFCVDIWLVVVTKFNDLLILGNENGPGITGIRTINIGFCY